MKKIALTSFILLALLLPSSAYAVDLVGNIAPPPGVDRYGNLTEGGFINFLTAILRTLIVIGGIYALFNFILAGFQYMTAAGDPKMLQLAWARIWQSLIGLIFLVGSFILAAIIGYVLVQDPLFILKPTIVGPN